MKRSVKKRTIRKTAAFVAASLVAAGCLAATASAGEGKTVRLRIEGISAGVCDREYRTDADALDAFLKEADAASEDFELTIAESEYGAYISAVNGDREGAFGGYEGWLVAVNGKDPGVGMSSVGLSDGDSIVVYYADPFEAGFQFPEADLERLEEGVIRFTSSDTVYDEDYNPSVAVNPVSDMIVKWYTGETDCKEYRTDGNGEIRIDGELLKAGGHRVEYYKYDSNGLPLVLRNAPGYTVTVKNNDWTGAKNRKAAAMMCMCAAALAAAAAAVIMCAAVRKKRHAE